jgi:signal transduction histidine kinase
MNLKNINRSITWKLFIVTTLIFSIFISSTLIIQSLFFESFYISKKKSDIQNAVEKFKISYDKIYDDISITELIREFEDNNNAKIVIFDNNDKMEFITKSGNNKIDAGRIRIINNIIRQWTINSNIISTMRRQNKPITVMTQKIGNETRNIVSAVPDNKKGEVIFAISSLQPVNEASSVIREFYLYFYIGALFLIIILSLMYSNMISKPLLKLNESASKMATLDFSKKCNIKREDEIGNLAKTLNFLSENLDKALTSLKDANIKLEEDIEKERRIEKARKEFVAAVSHELKTPISLIGGYTEGLKDDIFAEEEKSYYIDVILDETHKMANLVADMLDLSQLELGNFKLVKEEFFIDELVNFTLKKFLALINEKQIKLEMNFTGKERVYADWSRIEQVIINFVTNAIRHTEKKGSIKIEVSQNKEKAVFSIENTGKQIPEEELNKIWDNFYKIDKSRNRKLGGTGLGLAIVKNILMLHDGDYGVENTEFGVKFYFALNMLEFEKVK